MTYMRDVYHMSRRSIPIFPYPLTPREERRQILAGNINLLYYANEFSVAPVSLRRYRSEHSTVELLSNAHIYIPIKLEVLQSRRLG